MVDILHLEAGDLLVTGLLPLGETQGDSKHDDSSRGEETHGLAKEVTGCRSSARYIHLQGGQL